MLKVLVQSTPYHRLQWTSQKESNILLCSNVLYFISYYILYFILLYNSTLCKYYSIILYFIFYFILQYLLCTVRIQIHFSSLGVPTTVAATIVILLCHWVLEGFPVKKDQRTAKLYMFEMCSCWCTRFGWVFQWIFNFSFNFYLN